MSLKELLRDWGAPEEVREWVESQDGSVHDLWQRCDRGDWLLCLAARVGVDRRLVVLAACDCVEPALVHVPAGEEGPQLAVNTARQWAQERVTEADVRSAALYAHAVRVAYDTSYSAYAARAADAAYYTAEIVTGHNSDAATYPGMSCKTQ